MDNQNSSEFAALWSAALAAGLSGERAATPSPMVVCDAHGTAKWKVDEGEYGYATIYLDGQQPFARWLARNGLGDRYPRGKVTVCCLAKSRSASRARARAEAMSSVLEAADIPVLKIETSLD